MKTISFSNSILSLVIIMLFTAVCVACGPEPQVSKYSTTESFNATQEVSSEILDEMGYGMDIYYASPYYKYVLSDGNKKCEAGGDFCTSSDQTERIYKSDRCIKCGRTWEEHEDY